MAWLEEVGPPPRPGWRTLWPLLHSAGLPCMYGCTENRSEGGSPDLAPTPCRRSVSGIASSAPRSEQLAGPALTEQCDGPWNGPPRAYPR